MKLKKTCVAHKKYNNNTLFFNVTLTSKCCSRISLTLGFFLSFHFFSFFLFFLAADCSKNLIFEQVKSKERTLRDVPLYIWYVHTLYGTVPISVCECVCVDSCTLYHTQTK